MRIPLRYQSAQNTAQFAAFPQMLISPTANAPGCLFCANLAVRRHQLLACRDSYAELLDRRGDATWFLTVGRLLEAGPHNSAANFRQSGHWERRYRKQRRTRKVRDQFPRVGTARTLTN